MAESSKVLVVLGPTASGKTALGVQLAKTHGGEIISADSRQVYRGLNIGAGKDLEEYSLDGADIPYHLIDIVGLDREFNVFEYQRRFFEVLQSLRAKGVVPMAVGGTGLYLESVLKGYRMVDVPENPELRAELAPLPHEELVQRLHALKQDLHNTTDTEDRHRLVRAIEIATHTRTHEPEPTPSLDPLILGIQYERQELYERIARRLRQRLEEGMIEEVETLRKQGVSDEKLRFLGLEYRYITDFLEGEIKNRNDLFQKLNGAIRRFAKRQGTWFRRMERNGAAIHWIKNGDYGTAFEITQKAFPPQAAF